MLRHGRRKKPLLVNGGGETGRWQIFRPPRTTMEFFPANRACRKSVPCSSMIVCCRRKFGTCPGTREPKRKKCFAMETWKLAGAKGVADFCFVLRFLLFLCIERALGFLLGGGLGSSFAKSSLLLRDVVILLIRIQRFDLHGVLWSQGTPEEGRWLYRSTICI